MAAEPARRSVRASTDGLVTAAGRMAGYGSMIQLAHGFGMGTRYGHLSRVMVAPGQRVQARRRDRTRRLDRALDRTALHYECSGRASRSIPRKYLGEALF